MEAHRHRQPMHNSRAAMGNIIHFAGAVAPLIIGEVIKNPETRWRAIRVSAAITALASGVLWRDRVQRERQESRER